MSRFDITIAGEINLDLILYGLPEEMPTDREVLANDFRLTLGSSSAILAHNLACLGLKVGFIALVGDDPLGKIALDRLNEAGVDTSACLTAKDGLQTGVTVLLHHGRSRHILTYPGTMSALRAEALDLRYLRDARHFHTSSLFLQTALLPGLASLFRDLKSQGLTISLDTNDDPSNTWGDPLPELLGLCDLILPNDDEARRMSHCETTEEAVDWLAERVPNVAVKCGSQGSLAAQGTQRWTIPAIDGIIPIDTIGAGDSFNSGFLHAFLQGKNLPECATEGNATAALSTLRPGGTESFRDHTFATDFLAQHLGSASARQLHHR